MLKIRLSRIGTNKKPFYRVVLVDERAKRTGAYLELLGTYNPLTEPKDIKLKQDRIDYWIKQGAQPSFGFLRMIGKAPQRPARKPKKEKKQESESQVTKVTESKESEESSENPENSDKKEPDSVKTEDQQVSEPENQKSDLSETPTPSDTPSSSESSEKEEVKS